MKNLIIFTFMALTLGLNAQTFTTSKTGGGFDVSTGTDLNKTIMIDGTSYDVFATTSGSEYIICNSPKTGNDYPVWVGEDTGMTHEEYPVRLSKKGKYFILKKGKSGNPYCKYLIKN